uniref:Uncharacterized protein n=1 Tax=Romanomermis culicivorax TaxID=13658 RepID=A0A915KHX2_ROMCU
MTSHVSNRRYQKVEKLVRAIKCCIAFLISHVGLCLLVIAYAMLGAVVFRTIESEQELETASWIRENRRRIVDIMWSAAYPLNKLNTHNWYNLSGKAVLNFKQTLLGTISKGYDAKDSLDNSQWSYSGAFLYSLTVSTTIGQNYYVV